MKLSARLPGYIFLIGAIVSAPAGLYAAASATPSLTTVVSVSADSFIVSWKEKNNGDVIYKIIAATSSGLSPHVSSAAFHDPASSSNTIANTAISGLSPNARYWVSVQAQATGKTPSSWSSPDNDYTLALPVSPSFINVWITSATVGWDLPEGGAAGFRLEASTDPAFSIAFSSKGAGNLGALTVKNLSPLTTYFFRVAGLNPADAPNHSIAITTTTLPQAPEALPKAEKPTMTTIIAVSTDSFTVTWKEKNSGNVSFLIAAALDPDNIAGTMVSSAAFHDDLGGVNKIATTTIYGLIPNGLYYVSVAAYKTDRLLSGFSSPDKAATLANPPGPATAWPAGRNTYQIRWNPNNNSPVTVYEVTRSFSNFEADISTAVGFNAGLTQTEVLLDGFTPALTHFVRMRAKNRDSIITAYSDSLAVTAPAPPGFLSATIKSGEAVVIVEPGEAVRLELGPAALPAEAAIYISPDPISAPLFVDPSRLEAAVDRLGGRRIFRNTMREFVAIAGNTLVETNFLGPVRLQISYAGLDADNNGLIDGSDPGINVMRLAIAVFNESRGDFTPCPNSTIELDAKTVSCRLEHFSVYVLAADIKPFSGADDVYAFPVPWRPNDSDSGNGGPNGITFANLPNEGEIRIYDIAAGLVKKIPLTGQAQIPWNGSNDDGFPAASGVYVWHLNGAAGSKTGKLMIIR